MLSLSTQKRVADFLRDAERTGLIAETERKVRGEDDAKRKQLVAELEAVPAEREKTLPPLKADIRKIGVEINALEQRLAGLKLQYNDKEIDLDGATATLGRREYVLRRQLGELAPEILSDTDIRLQRLADRLKDEIYFRVASVPTIRGGLVATHVSNDAAVWPVIKAVKGIRSQIEAMVYSVDDFAAIENRCQAMIAEVRAKATAILSRSQLREVLGEEPEATPPRTLVTVNAETRGKR